MAIPASIGDRYQVRIVGVMEGQQTNNILYFGSVNGDTDVEVHLILVLAACFVTHLIPVMSSVWTLQELRWKRVYPTLGTENITVPPGTLVGGAAATALPSFCSAVVSIRTALGGRSKRGRMYIPGIPESATIVSAFDTGNAFWTAFVAFLACIATNFVQTGPPGANAWQQEIYSRKIGGSTFPLGLSGFESVKTLKPVQQLGTTRSRKVGVGS
jgi:hypothetical protein